jgi:hypothetical protein
MMDDWAKGRNDVALICDGEGNCLEIVKASEV